MRKSIAKMTATTTLMTGERRGLIAIGLDSSALQSTRGGSVACFLLDSSQFSILQTISGDILRCATRFGRVSCMSLTVREEACRKVHPINKTASSIDKVLLSPRKRGNMFSPALVCVSVCVSVTTITKKIVHGFAPNFMRTFLGEREDQVRVSLQSVGGCGSNGQINSVNRRLFTK